MSHRLNLFAYTAVTGAGYPPYISVNVEVDGRIVMHVRAPAKPDGTCGDPVTVEIPRDQIVDFSSGLLAATRLK